MKTMKRILAFVLMLCFVPVLASCTKMISGTYSAEKDGQTVFYTFGETDVSVLIAKATHLSQTEYTEYKGTYELNKPLFGDASITITFEDENAAPYSHVKIAFSEDEENGTISFGDTVYKKTELPDKTPVPVSYTAGGDIGGMIGALSWYTFAGNQVTLTNSFMLLGNRTTVTYDGTYEIKELADGSLTISMTFEDSEAAEYAINDQVFKEDVYGEVITIGMVMYAKVK